MSPFSPFLTTQGFVILDGGLATELESRGHSLNDPLWSAKILLSNPEQIAGVHHAYLVAGADVIITASYQATFPGLQAAGLSRQKAEDVLRNSVAMAVEARERFWSEPSNRTGRLRPLIAASIGPYGAFLHDGSEYRGDYLVGRSELKNFHRDRMQILAASGADLFACETIPSRSEAEVLIELLDEIGTLPAWISFTGKDGSHISDGSPFAKCAALANDSEFVNAVGLNCTAPSLVNDLLEKAHAITRKPLVAYPNSGELYDIATCSWQSTSEIGMIEKAALGWRDRGALLIGGCCRTTPDTVRAIRHALSASVPVYSGNN